MVLGVHDEAGGWADAPAAYHRRVATAEQQRLVTALAAGTSAGLAQQRRPGIGLTARLVLADWCSCRIGYSLLYWNKVLCPGDQMDAHVNITQLPLRGPVSGALAPMPLFVHTDYFAQGLDVGLEFTF